MAGGQVVLAGSSDIDSAQFLFVTLLATAVAGDPVTMMTRVFNMSRLTTVPTVCWPRRVTVYGSMARHCVLWILVCLWSLGG